MAQLFPFGTPVQKVEQKVKTPKDYFVLGVYASAVHAKWIGKNGKLKVRALAVASEPTIFWTGDREEGDAIIEQIKISPELGHLELADIQFNGPSGKVLDEKYLKPLGLSRKDVWLSDLLPYARLNSGQVKAIKREYEPLQTRFNLPDVTLEKVPKRFADSNRITEIIEEIKESGAKKIILLGDIPIKEFLYPLVNKQRKLADFENYGAWHEFMIKNETYEILPLVHPRQAGKLGRSNHGWFEKHEKWIAAQS